MAITKMKVKSSPEEKNTKKRGGIQPRSRTKYTVSQLQAMENIFFTTQYPDSCAIEDLSKSLGVSIERISIWFQNRRSKFKRQSKGVHMAWMRKQIFNQDSRQTPVGLPVTPGQSSPENRHLLSPVEETTHKANLTQENPRSNLHYMPMTASNYNPVFNTVATAPPSTTFNLNSVPSTSSATTFNLNSMAPTISPATYSSNSATPLSSPTTYNSSSATPLSSPTTFNTSPMTSDSSPTDYNYSSMTPSPTYNTSSTNPFSMSQLLNDASYPSTVTPGYQSCSYGNGSAYDMYDSYSYYPQMNPYYTQQMHSNYYQHGLGV
ncbi:homeobox protein ceh-37 [Patella vulgata]|uniref:homeobox protein ceh-37 n=1 Tax=Patella vulgata TaxID=6465 RepID=UPI0024A7BF27|nr:homeobox protein ceh-37 [Patella vulgata]